MERRTLFIALLFCLGFYIIIFLPILNISVAEFRSIARKSENTFSLRTFDIFRKRSKKQILNCKNLEVPILTGRNNDWQNVTDNGMAYIYSAYRESNFIRIIGAAENDISLYCQVWARDGQQSVSLTSVQTIVIYLPETHRKR